MLDIMNCLIINRDTLILPLQYSSQYSSLHHYNTSEHHPPSGSGSGNLVPWGAPVMEMGSPIILEVTMMVIPSDAIPVLHWYIYVLQICQLLMAISIITSGVSRPQSVSFPVNDFPFPCLAFLHRVTSPHGGSPRQEDLLTIFWHVDLSTHCCMYRVSLKKGTLAIVGLFLF